MIRYFILILFTTVCFGKNPVIIAHRGASAYAPENTISSFQLAWELKAPIAECDIYLSRDNQVVVIHDKNTKRTTGFDANINDMNYSQISTLDAGSFKDKKYAGEKIPLLADVINTVPKNGKLFVEIKCDSEVLPYLENVINKSGKRKQIVIISFDIDVLANAKKLMPDIPILWLASADKDKDGNIIPYNSSFIQKAKEKKLDGLDLNWQGFTKEFVDEVHKAGFKIDCWTVDDINEARKLKAMNVDGITTNKPDFLIKNL